MPLLYEGFGLANDRRKYVYLSDGGHFDNLGLYEMVLRRCHLIVVSDAGQDGEHTFEDLANAVRKVRIDLGVEIIFDDVIRIYPRDPDKKTEPWAIKEGGGYAAIGRIEYSVMDGKGIPDGILIYLKPAINGSEPRDVLQYAKAHPEFPHESTTDQFFSESQFESYRRLGCHAIDTICGEDRHDYTLNQFVTKTICHIYNLTDDKVIKKAGQNDSDNPLRGLLRALKENKERPAESPNAAVKPGNLSDRSTQSDCSRV